MKVIISLLVCMVLVISTFAADYKKEYKTLNEVLEFINKMKTHLTMYLDGHIWIHGLDEGKALTTAEKNTTIAEYESLKDDLKDLIKTLP